MEINQGLHIIKKTSFISVKYFLLVLFFSLIVSVSFAQEFNEDFKSIDKSTYFLYTQKDWDSLILIGNQALKSGVDYFYLRERIGIAWYEKGNYFKASTHFEKALKFNASESTTQEYLYYSYIFSNRKKEARVLSTKFNTSLVEKLNTQKNNVFEKVYIETGPTFSNNIKLNQIQRPNRFNNNILLEQDLNDDRYYAHLGFEVNISKRISAYLGYSYLRISKLKQILFPGMFPQGNSNTGPFYNEEYKLFQNEFYGNMKFAMGKGFLLTPAYHLVSVKSSTIYPDLDAPSFANNGVIQKDISFANHIVSLGLNKNISIFKLGTFTSWSNLNKKNQYQLGGLFSWFPFGNLNLYTTTSIVSAWEEKDNRIVFDQLVGGKVAKKLWLEGYVTLGEMVNYNEKNAFVVHNSGDKIKFRTGLNIILSLSKKIELSVRYIYLQEEGYRFVDGVEEGQNTTTINYQNNTIIGGIKWTL